MSNQDTREPTPRDQESGIPPSSNGAPLGDLECVKLTDVGRVRSHNEDYVDAYVPPDARQLERKGAIYLVADGMGGHQAGEVASRGAVELVIGQYYSDLTHDIGTSLVRAFRAANQLIYDQAQADPSKAGMGTTLVAAVILGRKVYLANVGDSRAYLVNKAGITQITEDHSWVEEQVRAGLLTPEQAGRHPQRNLVTRALGTKPSVEIDLFEGDLDEGDMLLMCSDGLTGRVEDREIATIVKEHAPQEAGRRLIALANERGGNDNITVLIVGSRKEATTVVAPAVAAAAPGAIPKKQARKLPLIPILVTLAAALMLALGGLAAARILFKGEPTPTPTVEASAVVPTVTVAMGTEPALPEASTQPQDSTQAPDATATTGDDVSSALATATLAATYTPAPTVTPRPTFRSQPTATDGAPPATPAAVAQKPTLLEPDSGDELQGEVTFRWSYGMLPAGRAFQVLIWKDGELQKNGADAFVELTQQTINLDVLKQTQEGGVGTYYWTVVVVDKMTENRLAEATERGFSYLGPEGEKQKPSKPSPGEEPPPTIPRP